MNDKVLQELVPQWNSASRRGDINELVSLPLVLLCDDELGYAEYAKSLLELVLSSLSDDKALASPSLSTILVALDATWSDIDQADRLVFLDVIARKYSRLIDQAAKVLILEWVTSFENVRTAAELLLVLFAVDVEDTEIEYDVRRFVKKQLELRSLSGLSPLPSVPAESRTHREQLRAALEVLASMG